MKYSLPIIYLSLLCFTVYSYCDEAEALPPAEEDHSKEVALLEPNQFSQLSIAPSEVEISPSAFTPRYKSSFIAVGLSSLIPGLGHTYLGDYKTAAGLFGSYSLIAGMNSVTGMNKSALVQNFIMLGNTWSYGIYAAYRDVRAYNVGVSYSYQMPTDSFNDLAFAPFRWSVIKKKEVWGGLLAAYTLAAGLGFLISSQKTDASVSVASDSLHPLLAFPVGLGEEALFRGYLQSQISEISNPWIGITLSSLIFGAVHIPNGRALEKDERWRYYSVSVPFITALGAYFGWMTYKNRSLKESVALHAWYDFFIFLAQYSVAESAINRKPSFALSFSF